MYERQESEYYPAKMKAARRVCQRWVKPADLPSNAEIRDEILQMARLLEGDQRLADLRRMRLEAVRLMRLLERFAPRLVGSVLTGHVRRGSDIDLHLFADSLEGVTATLDFHGIPYDVQHKVVVKDGRSQRFRHVHVRDEYTFELTIYPVQQMSHVPTSSITGRAMERMSIRQLESMLRAEYPEIDVDEELAAGANRIDRFQLYDSLLLPLENTPQDPRYHPEGDVLYHSLQVFDLAAGQLPYDEEFLTAALLHDVGKAIDPAHHVEAALEALSGFITPRTSWLIAHHMDAHRIAEGTLGGRAKRRLESDPSFEELMLLARCDRLGRRSGVETTSLEEALHYLREMVRTFG
jgi:hypothetical protein